MACGEARGDGRALAGSVIASGRPICLSRGDPPIVRGTSRCNIPRRPARAKLKRRRPAPRGGGELGVPADCLSARRNFKTDCLLSTMSSFAHFVRSLRFGGDTKVVTRKRSAAGGTTVSIECFLSRPLI